MVDMVKFSFFAMDVLFTFVTIGNIVAMVNLVIMVVLVAMVTVNAIVTMVNMVPSLSGHLNYIHISC
jgi:hypothetical protein